MGLSPCLVISNILYVLDAMLLLCWNGEVLPPPKFPRNAIRSLIACRSHAMHAACLEQYAKTNYKCGLCSESLVDMSQQWRRLDREVAQTPLPPQFWHKWVRVLCNDCHRESDARFHFVGVKCPAALPPAPGSATTAAASPVPPAPLLRGSAVAGAPLPAPSATTTASAGCGGGAPTAAASSTAAAFRGGAGGGLEGSSSGMAAPASTSSVTAVADSAIGDVAVAPAAVASAAVASAAVASAAPLQVCGSYNTAIVG